MLNYIKKTLIIFLLINLSACSNSTKIETTEILPEQKYVLSTNEIKKHYIVDIHYFEYEANKLYSNKDFNILNLNKKIKENNIKKVLSEYGTLINEYNINIKNYTLDLVSDFESVQKKQKLLYLSTTGIYGYFLISQLEDNKDLFLEYDITKKDYSNNNLSFLPSIKENNIHSSSILEMSQLQIINIIITPENNKNILTFLIYKIKPNI